MADENHISRLVCHSHDDNLEKFSMQKKENH